MKTKKNLSYPNIYLVRTIIFFALLSIGYNLSAKDTTKSEKDTQALQKIGTETIRIYGSSTIGNTLVPELIKAYAKENGWLAKKYNLPQDGKHVKFDIKKKDNAIKFTADIKTPGSSSAFQALLKKEAQLGMASRPIKEKENNRFINQGLGDMQQVEFESIVALDGIIIAVHPNSSIESLSLSTIAKIFSGEIKNWSHRDIGLSPNKINIYTFDKNSGTRGQFNKLVMKANNKEISKKALIINEDDLTNKIKNDPNGIGYTNFSNIKQIKALSVENECGMFFTPSLFSVKNEEYPLSRRLFIYRTNGILSKTTNDLLSYMVSENSQKVINKEGFISQKPMTHLLENQGQRIASVINHLESNNEQENIFRKIKLLNEFILYIRNAKRLSITFRFNPTGFALDNKARSDIKRLVTFMQKKENQSLQLMLLGFTDNQGDFSDNLKLSLQRANMVANILEEQGIPVALKKGYGELSPITCNENRDHLKNRRVEVWLTRKIHDSS